MSEQGELRTLREWTPMTHLLQQIPLKAQRGLFTHQLNLTCVDCLPEHLVLGTNLGLVYWYDRRKDELQRLRCENSSSPIACVRVVSTLDYMIAAGSEDGNVTVFQIPRPSSDTTVPSMKSQQNRQIERFTISGLHLGPVTALEWSPNGMNLFSGDRLGIIVLTEIDFYMHLSKSREVLNEKYEVVQLSYHSGTGVPHGKLLLVSTVYRTTLCSWRQEDRTWKVSQLGQRERKTLGQFGATFYHPSGMEVASHRDIIFASRPGLRLWQAGLDGVVQQTLIFKDALMCPHPSIMLVNPVPSRFKLPKVVNGKNKDRRTLNKNEGQPGVEGVYQHQLGYLSPFGDGLIVVHWKGANGSLLVLDTEDTGVITSVKTGPGGLRSIISVAVTPAAIKPAQNQLFDDDSVEQGPEIFVLEGSRSLIRIAYNPDYNYSKGSEEQEEGISSSVRSLFSSAIFPPSLPSPPPLLKDLTTSLIELTTGPGFGSYKAGESGRTLQKGDVSSLDPKKDASPSWHANKKVWMTSAIFEPWLKDFNANMVIEKRKVILFLDNAPCHPIITLSNIKLLFLPPNTMADLQLLDQGIIQSFKPQYCKRVLRSLVVRMDKAEGISELIKLVDIGDAVSWTKASWNSVSQFIVKRSFERCGLLAKSSEEAVKSPLVLKDTEEELKALAKVLDASYDVDEELQHIDCFDDLNGDWETHLSEDYQGRTTLTGANINESGAAIIASETDSESEANDENYPPVTLKEGLENLCWLQSLSHGLDQQDEEANTSEERKGRNESVVMADEALEIPPIVGMPFETIPNLQMTAAGEAEAASKESLAEINHVEEALENSRQKMYEEVLYKPKKKKKEEKRKKSAAKALPCLLEPGGPCSEGSSSLSTSRSEEDSSHAVPVDAHVPSTARELVINGPLYSSWPPPGKQDEAESRDAKTSQKLLLDKMEGVEWRRKSEVVASANLRSSVVEEGHVGGVEAWLPSMPLAPDLRSPTSIRQDVESKGELLAKLLDLKPILPRPLPEPQVEEKCILPPDEPISLLSERSYTLKVADGPDMDTNSEPPKLLLETSESIGESESVSKKRMSLPLEREGSIDQRIKTEATVKLNLLKKESVVECRKESSSSDSDWELL